MTRRKNPPRERQPQQPRSLATVEALLDATGLIVRDRGVEAVSVRAVLKRAGVAPGSAYQYFRSGEALVAAWELRELRRIGQRFFARIQELLAARPPIEHSIRMLVLLIVDAVLEHTRRYNRPIELVTRLSQRRELIEPIVEPVATFLANTRERARIAPADVSAAARTVIFATTHSSLALASAQTDDDQRIRWRLELADMVATYLIRDAAPRPPELVDGFSLGVLPPVAAPAV